MKVKMIHSKTVSISREVEFGDNVMLGSNVVLKGKCKIGNNVIIGSNSIICESSIGNNSCVESSVVENSVIGSDCIVGPFAHLRPNTVLADNVKIGNFVEVKNSSIGFGSKASHLAYIGDADIGENVNIGCGVIFANYNGKEKNRSRVGDESFIGSNCNIIAPVNIAKRSYICAGTTVTNSTNESDFVIGRVRQEVKPKKAEKYLKRGK